MKFTSRFLHPAEASLLLISKPKHGMGGITMTFALKGEVLNIKAIVSKFYVFFLCFCSQTLEWHPYSHSPMFYFQVALDF